MATYYIDPTSGNNANAGTSAAAPVQNFGKWSNTVSGGNTYKLKRGTTLNMGTQCTGLLTTGEIVITSYYNSDGTDDEAQAKPILKDETIRTSFTSRNSTIAGTWGFTGTFWGLVSDHVFGRERDYESAKTSWPNTTFDTLNDWDYITTLGQSVIYNGSSVTPPAQVITHDLAYTTGAPANINRPYLFWFRRPSGGVKISNIHFKNAYGAIAMDFGNGTSSLPLVDDFWVYNCKFENLFQAIGLKSGATDGVGTTVAPTMDGSILMGVTNMRLYGNRFTYIGQSGIAHVGGSNSWTSVDSWIKWNIFDHCCQAHSNGAIYLQGHFGSGTPRSILDISYNSASYTGFGNLYPVDGMDFYAEWLSTDIVFDYNFSWNSARAGQGNPYGVGTGVTFKHHIHVNTGSGITGATSFTLSGSLGSIDPQPRQMTIYCCISKDVASYFFVGNGWTNRASVAFDRIYGKGTGENGSNVGSAINTMSGYAGTLIAPVQNSYLTGYTGTGCKIFWSQVAGNAPSAPTNFSYHGIGSRVDGETNTNLISGFFSPANANPTSITSLLGGTIDIMSQITTPTDVEHNYSLDYGNTFWAQIDPLVTIPSSSGSLYNTRRIRRN